MSAADVRAAPAEARASPASLDLRLALPAAVAWLALGILIGVDNAAGIAAVVCTVLALGSMLIATTLAASPARRSLLAAVAVTCIASAVVLASASAQADARRPAALLEAAEAGRFVTVTATLSHAAGIDGSRFRATVDEVRLGEHLIAVSVPVLVFASLESESAGAPAIGSRIAVAGRLVATEPADDVAFLLFARQPAELISRPSGLLAATAQLREGFRERAQGLPGAGGGLLPGLSIGDTSAVSPTLDSAMKASALSHLTAVSGANCAVVVGLVLALGGTVRMSIRARIVASVVVLTGFVVLVTPEPSVLRAAVMAAAVLFARAAGRGAGGVSVLSLAVLVLLAIDPWLARSFGFILSVFATAGLLVLAGPLAAVLGRFLPLSVASIIAVPLAAQLACQPVLILLAPSIPLYGVVANLLAEPAAPLATVLGLLACLIGPWWPWLAGLVAQLAWLPASWIAAVALFFGRLPGRALPWLEGAAGVALAVAITVVGLLVVLRAAGRMRRAASLALALLLVGYLGVVAGEQLRLRLGPPGDWQIAACDVGQGSATLVRSAGEVALIDAGPDPELLLRCLDRLGIDRLDLLVLTHFDLDHVGGVPAVLGRAARVLVGPSGGAADDDIVRTLVSAGAEVEHAERGQRGMLGELRWEVLWPRASAAPSAPEPGNDASIVLSVRGVGECVDGCLSAVFLGDLGEQSQAQLLAANRLGPVQLVGVAHHGSADQSARLYETLAARVGIIGVGADNDYGHPRQSILDVLATTQTRVARSDLNGLILVSPRGESLSLWTERSTENAH